MTIQEVKEKIYQQNHIDTKIKELEKRKTALQDEELKLWRLWKREEQDVERLEAPTLSAFWYALTGRKEQMLDKEKQEAYAASVKYSTVKNELEEIRQELERLFLQKRSRKSWNACWPVPLRTERNGLRQTARKRRKRCCSLRRTLQNRMRK